MYWNSDLRGKLPIPVSCPSSMSLPGKHENDSLVWYPHLFSGLQDSLTDMKVKWNTMESLSSNMSSGIEVTALWKGRRNCSGLSAAPAICSHHWQTRLILHIHLINKQVVNSLSGGTLPYESQCPLGPHIAPGTDFLQVALLFFHGERSFQCKQF